MPEDEQAPAASVTPPPTPASLIVPTLDPPRLSTPEPLPASYVVQAGDNLSAIAERFGVDVDRLIELNEIENPSLLSVGQVLALPELSEIFGPAFKIIPDSELVRGPASGSFDLAGYVESLPGLLRTYSEERDGRTWSGAEVIQRVVDEYSVNPRLLLALLEYRAGWLFDPDPDASTLLYPMGYGQFAYEGLYMQLAWTANRLNEAYYGWRARGETWFTFDDGVRVTYAPGMNAGTVAVQYLLSRNRNYTAWLQDVDWTGFYSTYVALFGDPFAYAIEPLLPPDLAQPPLQLPFPQGETWYYTGGPHGGFGTGSGWAAIDFAPPGDEDTAGCFVASQWATAVADGIVVRSGDGFVILDLDGDGDETTGWTIVYLHLASEGRAVAGTRVQAGDPLGHPSCEGGVSNATHLHLARRYNGEWIPAQCHTCAPGLVDIPFVLGGWTVRGLEGQEYQGYMVSGQEYRQAEQGRTNPINELSW
ncbi:MAG: LysM peptidoglycan-binding domain-containing protein [Anaerolineae bacterium]|nr:LysM peptidoglycan-binding domain-containing protein [Anaerolineae bacterium]